MSGKHVNSVRMGDATVIAISGATFAAINESSCWSGPAVQVAELVDEFAAAVGDAPDGVVVDLREVHYLDHASLSVLIQLMKLLDENKKPRVICFSGEIKEVADVIGLTRIWPSAMDLDAAMAKLARANT